MHKEMLNIGKIKEHNSREKQVVEILEKATRRRPPKTNVGRKRKVQQLARSTHARTHRQTDRQLVIGKQWRMWQGQLAKRCNWEIVWALRSMRHAKPSHASGSSTKNKRKTNPGLPFLCVCVCVCVLFFFGTF